MTLFLPRFITKEKASLSFCTPCALAIEEVRTQSQNKQNYTQCQLAKAHTDVEKQVENNLLKYVTIRNWQGWILEEIHRIRGESNLFCSHHFCTTSYWPTKAAKAMLLHTSSYWQIHLKIITKLPAKYQYFYDVKEMQTRNEKRFSKIVYLHVVVFVDNRFQTSSLNQQ